jgi:hypothetical protein
MKRSSQWPARVLSLTVLSVLLTSVVHAQDELDVTMIMVTDDAQLTESVVRQISLPESASAVARDKAQMGLDRASAAREQRRARGQEIAEQARSARESMGNAMRAERAQDARPTLEAPRQDSQKERPVTPDRPPVPGGRP